MPSSTYGRSVMISSRSSRVATSSLPSFPSSRRCIRRCAGCSATWCPRYGCQERSIRTAVRSSSTSGRADGRAKRSPATRSNPPTILPKTWATLEALHTIGADEAYSLGAGTRVVAFEVRPLREAAVAETTAIVGDAVPRFLAAPAPTPSNRRTLCHTDIKGEHVFVDDERRRVTAITDWADAEVCDPAKDYAGLVGWLGPSFTRACIEASGEHDPTLADRAIWLNRAGIIEYWDDALAGVEDAPIPLITEQLRMAFSD